MTYSGYLKPHEARIRELWADGKNVMEIARIIYAAGARSPYHDRFSQYDGEIASMGGIIRKMLFGYNKRVSRIALLTTRIARLNAAIADMQAKVAKAESEMEQARIDDAQQFEQPRDRIKTESSARRRGVAKMYRGGMTYAEIADHMRVTKARVGQLIGHAAWEESGRDRDHMRRIMAEWRQEHKTQKAAPGTKARG